MKRLIGFILICFSVSVYSQNFKAGIIAGPNLSFLAVNSDYNFSWSKDYNPGMGCEAGFYSSLKLSEKLNFESNILFKLLTHRDKKEITFRDDFARVTSRTNLNTIINYYLVASPMISYQVFKKWTVGTGINLNFLLASISKFNDYENKPILNNTYYKTFNLGIPIFIGFDHNKYYLRLKFDKGMINLMKDSDSYFKEVENTITISFGYLFLNK